MIWLRQKGTSVARSYSPFFYLEVIVLGMVDESEGIDSGNWLFESDPKECHDLIPNLIFHRQFNDRCKSVNHLCEQIRSRMAKSIDGGEDNSDIDSKPIEVCCVACGKRISVTAHLKVPISSDTSFMLFVV